jgi:multidrug efflux pump subunit AcrB
MLPTLSLVLFLKKHLFKAQTRDQLNLKTVGIGIYARSGASTVELSDDIKKKIIEVKKIFTR